MAQFTGKSVRAIDQMTINDNARPDTCSQCYHDKILQAASYTVCHFANSSSIGIVGQRYWYAQSLAEHVSQRHDDIVCPRQIGCILNSTLIIIAIWRADTH